jgi:hypothetical protein
MSELVYGAVAWQYVGQIRYNIYNPTNGWVLGEDGERGNIFPIGEVSKTWLPVCRENLSAGYIYADSVSGFTPRESCLMELREHQAVPF